MQHLALIFLPPFPQQEPFDAVALGKHLAANLPSGAIRPARINLRSSGKS